ncbi:hypothetical protein LUZ61_013661 [Rhynchospora tenuis]|uniref:Uncharacterized protein n=1 Tax=Rhynchospora tenuis TaxID=198213 RepID=A0AAD5W9K9_9POAL|nr:hypothetical protein LUZ61_013661 [Rhynchospora tenuis]
MQKHKWSMLRDFLARDENSGFEIYLREMRLLEAQVRECYSETVDMGSDDFVMINPVVESTKSRDDGTMSCGDTKRRNIPCVTELHEAGVKFRRKIQPREMFDISFEHGTMEMPSIRLDDIDKIILWNMVAFEQSQPYEFGSERILSSYLALMDSLINTEKDAAILDRSGILENYLQNDEQAANFFNQFSKALGIDYSDHYYYGLYKDIKRYSESAWHKNRARLKHDYFSNPWSSISVVAASILLILTFLQTYYSATK